MVSVQEHKKAMDRLEQAEESGPRKWLRRNKKEIAVFLIGTAALGYAIHGLNKTIGYQVDAYKKGGDKAVVEYLRSK